MCKQKMLRKLERLARKVKMASYQCSDEGWPEAATLLLDAVTPIAQARVALKPPATPQIITDEPDYGSPFTED